MPSFDSFRPRSRSIRRAPVVGNGDVLSPQQVSQFNASQGMQRNQAFLESRQPPAPAPRQAVSRYGQSAQAPGIATTGKPIYHVQRPDGSLVPVAAISGDRALIDTGRHYISPSTGKRFITDPASATGMRDIGTEADEIAAKQAAAQAKIAAKEQAEAAKAAEKGADEAQKAANAEKTNAFLQQGRKYYLDRVTGEPRPLQSDEEFKAAQAEKGAKLQEAAATKTRRAQLAKLEFDAAQVNIKDKDIEDADEAVASAKDGVAALRIQAGMPEADAYTKDFDEAELSTPQGAAYKMAEQKRKELADKAATRDALKQQIAEAKLRIENPEAYAQVMAEKVKGETPEVLDAREKESAAQIEATKAEITAKKQKLDAAEKEHADALATAKQRYTEATQTGDPNALKVAGENLQIVEQAAMAFEERSQAERDKLNAEVDEVNRDVGHLGIISTERKRRQDTEHEKTVAAFEAAAPGMGREYQSLVDDGTKRAEALRTKYKGREDSPEAKAAFTALQQDITGKAEIIQSEVAATTTKKQESLAGLWDQFGKMRDAKGQAADTVMHDWTAGKSTDPEFNKRGGESNMDSNFLAAAKKAGLSEQEARNYMETRRQMDWSSPLDPQKAEQGAELTRPLREKLGITEMLEPVRRLPDGGILPNPVLGGDEEAFKASIEATDGTKEQKDAAMKLWPSYRRQYGEGLLTAFAKQAAFGEDFTEWRESGKAKSTDPVEQALQYQDEMKGRSIFRRWGDLIASNVVAGFMDVTQAALGTMAAVSGIEVLSRLAAANSENAGSLVNTQDQLSNTGLGGSIAATIARMAPGVAATVGTGTMAGGMVFGAAQTAGSLYGDAYNTLRESGKSHMEAWKASAPASLAAGAMTAGLTKLFPGGVTALANNPEARASVRAMVAGFLSSGKAIAKGALDEIPEEVIDEAMSQLAQGYAEGKNPDDVVRDFITGLPELVVASGLMGGGMQALKDRQDRRAGGQDATAPTPEGPLPEEVEGIKAAIAAFNPTAPEAIQAMPAVVRTGPKNQLPSEITAKARASMGAVAGIASGEITKPSQLTETQMLALGVKLDKGGKLIPATSGQNAVAPLIYTRPDKAGNDQIVITDEARDWLKGALPDLAIGQSEAERIQAIENPPVVPKVKKPRTQKPVAETGPVTQAPAPETAPEAQPGSSASEGAVEGVTTGSKEWLQGLSDETLEGNIREAARVVNENAVDATQDSSIAGSQELSREVAELAQKNLDRLRGEQARRKAGGSAGVTPAPAAIPQASPDRQAKVDSLRAQGGDVVVVQDDAAAEALIGAPLVNKGRRGVTTRVNGKPTVVLIQSNMQGDSRSVDALLDEELHHAATLMVMDESPELAAAAEQEAAAITKGDAIHSDFQKLSVKGRVVEAAAAYASGKWKPGKQSKIKAMVNAIVSKIAKSLNITTKEAKPLAVDAIRRLAAEAEAKIALQTDTKADIPAAENTPTAGETAPAEVDTKPAKGGELIKQAETRMRAVAESFAMEADKPKATAAAKAILDGLRRYNGHLPIVLTDDPAFDFAWGRREKALIINPETALARFVGDSTDAENAAAQARQFFRHELIHKFVVSQLGDARVMDIWGQLPKEVQDQVQKAYSVRLVARGQKPKKLNPDHGGHEYYRAMLEAMKDGTMTEQVIGKDLADKWRKFLDDVLSLLRDLKKQFASIKSESKRAELIAQVDQDIKLVSDALDAFEKSISPGATPAQAIDTGAVSISGKPASGSGAAVATPVSRKREKKSSAKKEPESPEKPVIPAVGEKTQTVAGLMDLNEFEAKGYAPEQVTRADWVALQRAERRRLGQPEQGDNKNAPWAEYEEFHRDAVERAVKAGEEVDSEVLTNYPWLQAEVNIRPYVESLRVMSDAQLKTEGKRTATELNAIPKLLGDRVKFHEVSERFNAVNREIEARKTGKASPPTPAEQAPEQVGQFAAEDKAEFASLAEGLFASPTAPAQTFKAPIPPAKLGGFITLATKLASRDGEQRVDSPGKVAAFIDEALPGGKARALSDAFWSAIRMTNPALPAGEVDWQAVYAELDLPEISSRPPSVEGVFGAVSTSEAAPASGLISDEESARLDALSEENMQRFVKLSANQLSQLAIELGVRPMVFQRKGVDQAEVLDRTHPDDLKAALDVVTKPKAKADTPATAEAKVEEQVQVVAATEGQRDAKEIKSDIVAALEKAMAERDPANVKLVTFQIPGDGTFKIYDSADNIKTLMARVKRLPIKIEPANAPSVTSGANLQSLAASIARASDSGDILAWVTNAANADEWAMKVVSAVRSKDAALVKRAEDRLAQTMAEPAQEAAPAEEAPESPEMAEPAAPAVEETAPEVDTLKTRETDKGVALFASPTAPARPIASVIQSFEAAFPSFSTYMDENQTPAVRKEALRKIIKAESADVQAWREFANLDPEQALPEDAEAIREAKELLPEVESMQSAEIPSGFIAIGKDKRGNDLFASYDQARRRLEVSSKAKNGFDDAGTIEGFGPDGRGAWGMLMMAVNPNKRGNGIGTQMLRGALQFTGGLPVNVTKDEIQSPEMRSALLKAGAVFDGSKYTIKPTGQPKVSIPDLHAAFVQAKRQQGTDSPTIRAVFDAAKVKNPRLSRQDFVSAIRNGHYTGLVTLRDGPGSIQVGGKGAMSLLPITDAEIMDAADNATETPEAILEAWAATEPLQASPTASLDAEYMAAVEAGDMEKARRMVDKEDAARLTRAQNKRAEIIKALPPESSEDTVDGAVARYSAVRALLDTFTVPVGFTLEGAGASGGGSIYIMARDVMERDADGSLLEFEDFKLSIRNHEPSPFREKEFGKVNKYEEVEDPRNPREVAEAITKLEQWLDKKGYSQDPVTRDDAGNVIPLSQRFNPASDSILYATPTDKKPRRNVANQASNLPGARDAWDKLSQTYEDKELETVSYQKIEAAIDEVISEQAGFDRLYNLIVGKMRNGIDLSLEEDIARRMIARVLWIDGNDNPASRTKAKLLFMADMREASETARKLGSRVDKVQTPQQRLDNAMRNILSPSSKMIRERLVNVWSGAEKLAAIKELERRLASTQDTLQRERAQRELEKAKARQDQNEVMEQMAQEDDAKIDAILKRNGLTQTDLFLSVDDRFAMQEAVLEMTRAHMGQQSEQHKKAIEMSVRGYSDAAIAKETGLPLAEVSNTAEHFRNVVAKQAIAKEVNKGGTFSKIVQEGKKLISWILQAPPTAPLGSMVAKGTPTAAAVAAQIQAILNASIPTKGQRNAMTFHAATAKGKNGQNVKVFVPYDPSDWKQVYRLARELSTREATWLDKGYEYWINGILSGPQTHVVNTVSNALSTAWAYGPQWFAEATANVMIRNPNSPQFGEFKHVFAGFWKGIMPALRNFALAWSTEADPVEHQYLDKPVTAMFQGGNLDKVGGIRPSIGGTFGRIVRVSGRFLAAQDAFAKTLIMHAESAAMAYRLGKKQDLEGAALTNFMASQIATHGSESWQHAFEKAVELTFQDENDITKAVEGVSNALKRAKLVGWLFKFMLPFVRTPTNIYRAGIRKAGGSAGMLLYRLGKSGYYAIKGNNNEFRSYREGKMVKDVSESVMALVLWYFIMGMSEGDDDDNQKAIEITGSRPFGVANAGERASQLRQEGGSNLIIIRKNPLTGEKLDEPLRLPYGRYEPIALAVSTLVDGVREFKEWSRLKPQDRTTNALAGSISKHLIAQAKDKTFLQGISGFMDFLEDMGGKNLSLQDIAMKNLFNGVIPNLIRQPYRNIQDTIADSKKADSELSRSLGIGEAKVNEAGKPVTRQGNIVSRILFPVPTTPSTSLFDAALKKWNASNPGQQWNPDPITKADYYVYDPKQGSQKGKHALTNSREISLFETMIGIQFASLAARALVKEGYRPGQPVTPKMFEAIKAARSDAITKTRQRHPSEFRTSKP